MKLLLIGPYPPPYGGIATTVYDLHRYLVEQGKCEVIVLNTGAGRNIPSDRYVGTRGYWDYLRKVFGFARRRYTIHLETNGQNLKSWLSALVCAAAGLLNGRHTVIAFGSGDLPVYLQRAEGWPRLVIRAVVRCAGILICRNGRMRQALVDVGADPARITIVPGFLGLGSTKPAPVPREVQVFLNKHAPVLGATAGLEPEYGLGLMVAGLDALRPLFPGIGLVIIGPGQEAKDRIEGFARVRDSVCLTGPLPHEEALGIMTQLTLFVRPTYFDGDSNSVREALTLGVPVVASATDYRPPGVVTFRKGAAQDLVRALRYALEHPEECRARAQRYSQTNGFERVIALYRTLTEEAA